LSCRSAPAHVGCVRFDRGSQCISPYSFISGSAYFVHIYRYRNNITGDFWRASVTDTKAGTPPTVFAQLWLPAGCGPIKLHATSSLEYRAGSCTGLPPVSVGVIGPWFQNDSTTPTQAYGGYSSPCKYSDVGDCIYGAGCDIPRVLFTAGGNTRRVYTNTSEPLWKKSREKTSSYEFVPTTTSSTLY
jgi:hypothetical protein